MPTPQSVRLAGKTTSAAEGVRAAPPRPASPHPVSTGAGPVTFLAALRPLLAAHGAAPDAAALLASYARAETEIEAGTYRPYRDVLAAVVVRLGEAYGFTPSPAEAATVAASVRDWPPFPDSHAALAALATRYRLVLLSNVDDDLVRPSLDALGVAFDAVFTAQRIGSYKPARRNFEFLIAHAGVPHQEMLHVAQSLFHDIVPTRELGLATAWVNRRHGRDGSGATPPALVRPDVEVPDLRSLAVRAGVA